MGRPLRKVQTQAGGWSGVGVRPHLGGGPEGRGEERTEHVRAGDWETGMS